MKIAYILDMFPKISETFVLNEILGMQYKGVDVGVFALRTASEAQKQPAFDYVRELQYARPGNPKQILFDHIYYLFNKPSGYFKVISQLFFWNKGLIKAFLCSIDLVRSIERFSPDGIHSHFAVRATDIALLANYLLGVPFIFTVHGSDVLVSPPKNLRVKGSRASRCIAVSHYLKNVLSRDFGFKTDKINVVRCGVDTEKIIFREQKQFTSTIVCVARLEKIKGVDILIQACKRIKDRSVKFECLIVGDGPERLSLSKLIDSLGLGQHIHLLGQMTQNKVFSVISSNADIFVLPSRSESVGVAIMEAMAYGVPAIGPRIYGVPELIDDGRFGLLFQVGNDSDLADKICKLLDDGAMRDRLAIAARAHVESEFSIKAQIDSLLEIWRSILNDSQKNHHYKLN